MKEKRKTERKKKERKKQRKKERKESRGQVYMQELPQLKIIETCKNKETKILPTRCPKSSGSCSATTVLSFFPSLSSSTT
jgi:hypothetical protein